MPKVSVASVTASVLKRTAYIVVFVIALATGLWLYKYPAHCTLKLEQGCILLQTAKTPDQRAKGLGDRESLASDHGMLFLYERPQKTCFWMKDTRFALDIIWLNQEKQITKIEANVLPDKYPQTYCSGNDTKYVIELVAGAASRNQLEVGQKLDF